MPGVRYPEIVVVGLAALGKAGNASAGATGAEREAAGGGLEEGREDGCCEDDDDDVAAPVQRGAFAAAGRERLVDVDVDVDGPPAWARAGKLSDGPPDDPQLPCRLTDDLDD